MKSKKIRFVENGLEVPAGPDETGTSPELSIAHDVVIQQHGDMIACESGAGYGWRDSAAARQPLASTRRYCMTPRILYVEDEPNARQSLGRMLRRMHQGGSDTSLAPPQLRVAENGYQALEMLRREPCDLMLLDLMMPEMNGYQLLARLKSDTALRHIPVIVISGSLEIESIAKCIEMGAEDYLLKPFNPILLRARIGACLEKKRYHDQEAAYLGQLKTFNATLEQRVQEATTTIQDYTHQLERRLREMEAMSEVSLALSAVMDADRLLEMIMDTSKDVMQAEASSLLLLEDEGMLKFHVARGMAGSALQSARIELGRGIAGWAAQTGEPLLIPDAYQDPRFDPSYDHHSGFRTRSILTVPLKVKGKVAGVVQVINKIGHDAFVDDDLQLFLAFASQASVALENARLYAQTKAMAEDLRVALEKERWLAIEKEKMGAYIPKHVVDDISRNREQKLALGGKTMQVTVLFADIQGFTRLAETMTPQQVVSFLNVYMTDMTTVIEMQGGIIDKFIGDGIMAIFTPTNAEDNYALRGVEAGIQMQQKVSALRQQWSGVRPELASLQVRVGINTGEVVAGNIGSETRMDYTVVGDNVNVASRIESMCQAGEVCISESTYRYVQHDVQARRLEPILVKNRVQPVHIYAVSTQPNGISAAQEERTADD